MTPDAPEPSPSRVPEHGARAGRLPDAPACPFCDGTDTELVSAFGSHASVATYWCRGCHSPFEVLKWRRGNAVLDETVGGEERGP